MRLARFLAVVTTLLSVPVVAASAQEQAASTLASPPSASVQAAPERPLLQAGLGFVMGAPVGDFRDHVTFSAGVTGHLDFGVGRSPISIGTEATYLWYGNEGRHVPLVGLPDLTVGVNTANSMFLLHGRVRGQRAHGRLRPHVDGLVGFNYLVTSTTVDAKDVCTYTGASSYCSGRGDSITHVSDVVLSAGAGAGVQIGLGAPPHRLRLDVSLRYLYGGEADYLTEGDIRWQDDGPVILQRRRSQTDMLTVSVGLAFGR